MMMKVLPSTTEKDGMKKTFMGVRLRRLREERGMTQIALSRALDLSASYLNQLEQNQRPLTVPVLLKINAVFGVDVQRFSDDDEARLREKTEGVRRLIQAEGFAARIETLNVTEAFLGSLPGNWYANIGGLAALLDKSLWAGTVGGTEPLVFTDRLNHASLLDATRLAGATTPSEARSRSRLHCSASRRACTASAVDTVLASPSL